MNKLDAMRVLSNACFYLVDKYPTELIDEGAVDLLIGKFHSVRRSLQSITDLRPVHTDTVNEGYNGRMPAYF